MRTYDLLKKGLFLRQQKHWADERKKTGILRVGSTGIVLPDGTVAGKCARSAYLRCIGVEVYDGNLSKNLMFEQGIANEELWYETLIAGGLTPEQILREEKIPIQYELASGRKVTGRPDIVIGESSPIPDPSQAQVTTFTPKKVLELKAVCSLWTAKEVAINRKPTLAHLIQCGHYAWKLGVRGELWYTNRSNFAISFPKYFPLQGQPGSEFIKYTEDGRPKDVLPFNVGYEVMWSAEGTLMYRPIGAVEGMWQETIITQDGITRFLELVDATEKSGKVPPKLVNLNPDGSRGSYDPANYDILTPINDRFADKGLEIWTAEVVKWIAQLPQTGTVHLTEKEIKTYLKIASSFS